MEDKRDQAPSRSITRTITDLLDRGSVAVVVTLVRGGAPVGSKLLIDEVGSAVGTLGDPQLDSLVTPTAKKFLASREETRMLSVNEFAPEFPESREIWLLFERLQPAAHLVICGAGHVGASLARLGRLVGYRTTLIDDRSEFLKRERFPDKNIELVVADDWGAAVRQVIGNGRGVSVAVVTRGHNEDEQCMQAVLSASPDYVGLIGSKRRTTIVIDRLRDAGASEEQLKNVRAPIGLDIGAVSPEEVAVAIIAEIIAERRGAKGGSLSAWRRK